MKRVSGKDFCKALERAGWLLKRITGSHHIYEHPVLPGQASVPVHGNQTLKPGTQRRLMRTTGLTDDDL